MLSPLRGLVALGLLAAALVGLGGASANASHTPDGQPADRDFVTGESGGEVQNPGTPVVFRPFSVFGASSGRSGENPTGTVRLDFDTRFGRSTIATWEVTCLSVAGHQATIGGVAATNPFPGVLPANALFYVEDGVGGAPDRAGLEPAPTVPPTCPAPPFDETKTVASVTGELTVHDAVAHASRTAGSASAVAGAATASRASASVWRSSSRLASASSLERAARTPAEVLPAGATSPDLGDHPRRRVRRLCRDPQRRLASGVGDVAGERGDRAQVVRPLAEQRTRRLDRDA